MSRDRSDRQQPTSHDKNDRPATPHQRPRPVSRPADDDRGKQ